MRSAPCGGSSDRFRAASREFIMPRVGRRLRSHNALSTPLQALANGTRLVEPHAKSFLRTRFDEDPTFNE
jgi:hypothetical protein